jgi:formate hydrogenlyase transcriptional activator
MVSRWSRLHVFDKWRGRVQNLSGGVRSVLREKGFPSGSNVDWVQNSNGELRSIDPTDAQNEGCMMRAMSSFRPKSVPLDVQVLVDSIPALIHTARPDGHVEYFNKRWLDYLGVSLDEVAGWNWTVFIHPDDVEGILTKWRASLATGEIFEHETRVRKANGDYRWMFHRKVPLRDANGNIVKWYGSSLDINERKTAEEAFRISQAYLAEAQNLSHTGSWANAATGEPRYWSEECYRVLGFDPTEPLPTLATIFQRIHADDRTAMREQLDRAIRDKTDFEVEMRIVHPITGIRNIRSTGHAVVDTRGDLREMVGTVIDITEHKRAEEAIRRSEAYLAEAQGLSHTGSFGWRVSSGDIFWSDETFRIFECDPTSKPTIEFILSRVHREDHDLAQQQIDGALRNGEGFDFEHRLQMPDGSVKHVRVTARPSKDNAGEVEFVGAVTDITERKTNEERIRRLVEAGILGIYFATVEGGIVEANQAFLQLLQYDREDLISGRLRWADITPAEWRERDERSMAEFLATGVFRPYEKEYFRKDGSRVPVLVGGARMQSPSEGVVFVLDLSEQKRSEEKIRRSESYLAEAQRLSQTGSWAWSPDDDIKYWSEECYRVLSFDPRDGLPRFEQFFQRIHPDDQAGFRELIETAIRNKAEWEADYRIVHPDGPVRDIHVVGHPVLSMAGCLVEFVGTVIDVTERQRAEEERRRSEMELRQVLDLAPQHVAVFGPGRERIYANRATLDYLGVSADEWRQRTGIGDDVHPDDVERLIAAADRASSSSSGYELELRVRKGDGSYRWFLTRLHPVHDDNGQITRWYVACTDIEDRRQAEDRLRSENVALREEIDKNSMYEEIVGTSSALKSVLSRVSKVAPSDSTVLITGETGTGKELVARAIHRRSDRASRTFVSVNCAAIPRDLIASELFGHEKGAFTGATQQRLGRFELANGGTLFLDEVGELPAETQIALLRVLQEREFERIGGSRRIRSDVRVIAATNRDLQAAINSGTFRSDLFYRLNVFPIEMPSLRERREDIPILVEYFIDRYARKSHKNIKRVSKKTLELLQSYPWPGNIRELQNIIERSMILCETEVFSIDEGWLPQRPLVAGEPTAEAELPRRLLVQEKNMIEAALKETRGRVSGTEGAAVRLGIARSTLESKIRSLKINKNRFRTSPET